MGYGRSLLCALGLALGVTLGAAGLPASAVDDPTQYDPACPPAAAPDPASNPVRIMLTGDSMTNGTSGDYTWRYFFDHRLRAAGVNFDLVGPWSDLIDYTTFQWGHHDYADCAFDQDHDARGGAQLAEQLQPAELSPEGHTRIRFATETYAPDVVVEFFGYNDLAEPRVRTDPTSAPYTVDELLVNAKKFINEVRAANPDATIVMTDLAYADVPNASAGHQLLVSEAPDYNSRLAAKVPTWSTAQSRVVLADVANPDYWRGFSDTYDGAHPNAQGEVDLAAGMADAFAQVGIGHAATLPLPVVPIGPRTVPQLAGRGGLGSVTLSWKPVPGETRMLVYCREPALSTSWNRLPDVNRTLGAGGVVSPSSVTLTRCAQGGSALVATHTYEFRVQAAKVLAVATDIVSNTVRVTVPVQLGRVSGLVGTPAPHRADLVWRPVAGADHYLVDWRKAGSSAYSTVAAYGTSRSVGNLVAGQPYDFRVRAVGTSPAGPYAAPVTVTPRGNVTTVPPRPTLVRATGHRIKVYWHGVPGATRYLVQIRTGYGQWRSLSFSTGTSYLTQGLHAGTSYAFRIRPYDQLAGGGTSSASRITA
ncbi:MAG: GDSL-type esterase/lipase family protein [Marmoricola sp.]